MLASRVSLAIAGLAASLAIAYFGGRNPSAAERAEGPPSVATVRELTVDEARQMLVYNDHPVYLYANRNLDTLTDDAVPSAWVGVRMTPIPAPLAAHIGNTGLMVANVVEGSPADQTGIQQYDVVVAFDRAQVHNADDLVRAITEVGVGHTTEIVVIRKGERKTLSITPADRPGAANVKFKYDEPESQLNSLKVRGRKLRLGPDGRWIFEDLGPMTQLPDPLKEMKDFDLKNWQHWFSGKKDPFGQRGNDVQRWNPYWVDPNTDAQVEINVHFSDNDGSLAIRRKADGSYHVERVDPDGNRSEATYDSRDAFQDEDPDAFEKFQTYDAGGRFTILRPQIDRLPQMQQDFQQRFEEMVESARQRAEEAAERAHEAARQAYQLHASGGKASRLSIKLDSGGSIKIEIQEDGETNTYEFENVDQLRQTNPELYERVRDLIE